MRPKLDPITPGTYTLNNGAFEPDERRFLLRERKNTKGGKPPYYLTTDSFEFVSSLWTCNNGSRWRFDYETPDGRELVAYVIFNDGSITIEDGGESRRSQRKGSSPAPWH